MMEDELADFLNELNNLASDYGLVAGGYQQEEGMLQLLMIKVIGKDGKNGRIDNSAGKGTAKGN